MLQQALEKYLLNADLKDLNEAAHTLTERYRSGKKMHFADSSALKKAYLATRMPATFQVLCTVFSEAKKKGFNPKTILDLGSGPGTTAWAAFEIFENIALTLIEQDQDFIEHAKRLLAHSSLSLTWIRKNFTEFPYTMHDWAVFSYSLGEVTSVEAEKTLKGIWTAVNDAILIVEPGTPKGFETILMARSVLLGLGAHTAAPCAHANICSLRRNLKDAKDWCHFSTRVERSFLHRYAKEGSLAYEDEKFCYFIASKKQVLATQQRILRPPLKRSGHVRFTICTQLGLEEKILSKKDQELYKAAKKLDWGDEL